MNPSTKTKGESKGFSPWIAISFNVNYIIGTGFLTIPWAFEQGGIMLSTITMVLVALICNITKNYMLETMARAEQIVAKDGSSSSDTESSSLSSCGEASDLEYGSVKCENTMQTTHADDSHGSTTTNSSYGAPLSPALLIQGTPSNGEEAYSIKDRKFEYGELCHIFLGDVGEKIYIASCAFTQYLSLWGFTSVFSSAMAKAVPIVKDMRGDYLIYTAMFAAVVIPMSCLELKEQVHFQIVLTIFRFLVMGTMIVTALLAADPSSGVYFYDVTSSRGATMVNFSGFYSMFSVLVFATLFHNGIPVLCEPVADKTQLGGIFKTTLVICLMFYWLLGYVIARYFGSAVEQSSNINWNTFVGGTGVPSSDDLMVWLDVAWWAKSVSAFVVCFPAFNVVSAFPLNAIVLGDNMMVSVYGSRTNRLKKVSFRILSSVPPVIGAVFVKELGVITSYAGVFAIATALSFPPLLYIKSKRMMERNGKMNDTHYKGFASSESSAACIFTISIGTIIYILKRLTFG